MMCGRSTIGTRGTALLATLLAALYVATLFAPAANADAAADAEFGSDAPRGGFELTIVSGEGTSDARLTCAPIGIPGTHPDPEAACKQLVAADGNVERIPPLEDQMCTTEYDPVTVTAEGQWNGEERSYRATYSNHCVALVSTGGVLFAF